MTSCAWFPCYPGDLTGATDHLCNHDFGAYVRALCWYYTNGPLPDNDEKLRNMMRVEKTEWTRTRGNVMEFFQLNGDGRWHQKRADEVIQERDNIIERRRKQTSAARASNPKHHPVTEPVTNAVTNPVTVPVTNVQLQPQLQPQSHVQPQSQSKGETPQRKLSNVEHMTFDKEHDRVLSRMRCIKETYASHQRWDDKDKIEFQKLRGRLIELRTLLGIKI